MAGEAGARELRHHVITRLTDKARIQSFSESNAGRYLFELADLDDAAWPHTEYYGLETGGTIQELCLVYRALNPPNFIATVARAEEAMRELVGGIAKLLPPSFTGGFAPEIAPALAERFRVEDRGPFWRMAVAPGDRIGQVDVDDVELLTGRDEPEILDILRQSFTSVAGFDIARTNSSLARRPRPFFGIWRDGRLLSVAGTTFLSERYGVGVIGPVATRPDSRGKGLATRVCARLCDELAWRGARVIGLHVRDGNEPAIRCYERLGFEKTASFHSYVMTEA